MPTEHVGRVCSQVTSRPQSAQRLAQATTLGGSMTGEELLPPTALEHEMCVMSMAFIVCELLVQRQLTALLISGRLPCFATRQPDSSKVRCRYRSVEAAIRQLHMEPTARVRKRTRTPEIDLSTD